MLTYFNQWLAEEKSLTLCPFHVLFSRTILRWGVGWVEVGLWQGSRDLGSFPWKILVAWVKGQQRLDCLVIHKNNC